MGWGAKRTLLLVVLLGSTAVPALGATDVKPYLAPVDGSYAVKPLWSVGDTVPLTSDQSKSYRMTGIPDGLAMLKNPDGTRTVYMNHEFRTDVSTEPLVGQPFVRGAYVSELTMDAEGNVLSAELAFDNAYAENAFVGPVATAANQVPAFGRFCSSTMVGPSHGFDRPILLTNEEADAGGAFDPLGGSTVAIFDREAHSLPKLGHFSKENSVVMPGTGRKTVIVMTEDGPITPDSQIYMYVGTKSNLPDATVLGRNGLDNGKLYVLASANETKFDEATFTEGTIDVAWRLIPNADVLSDADLEAASDGVRAFPFVRPEDVVADRNHPNQYYFSTTGAPEQPNVLGRLYQLSLNPTNPIQPARLKIVTNADLMHPQGLPVPLAPDNLGASKKYLMVQEGGNGRTKEVMTAEGRNNSIWRLDLVAGKRRTKVDVTSALRIAQVNPPGRDNIEAPAGNWEASGIIPVGDWFGPGSWLSTVQAFPPTTEPVPGTFRDGQLVGLYPVASR